MKKYRLIGITLMLCACFGSGCGKSAPKEFVIVAGSENESLQPLLAQFGQKNSVTLTLKYKGSVDIMQDLGQADIPYDAVWPANSLWLSLGDKNRKVKDAQSIMTSPVVFGIKKSLAEKLDFVGKTVQVKDLLAAIRQKQLSFLMTSATQSNSGAAAYIGFLYALLGNPDMITSDLLRTPQLRKDIKELLGGVNRSSGSSGWLKDLFLNGNYDAMVNYEAVLIETNQALVKQGKEPLYLVYPVDGIVFSDSPLGYIEHGDPNKAELFKKLQAYLLSDEIQAQILKMGRRTGVAGMMGAVDNQIFNPAWGIDVKKILSPIKLPAAEVIQEALSMYQGEFRKPSFTVFCLDFSGSMADNGGAKQVKEAMKLLLQPELAKQYLLNPSSEDVTIVIPFNNYPRELWQVVGSKAADLAGLLGKIEALTPNDGTNIYDPPIKGLEQMAAVKLENYVPAIILMTDGQSNAGTYESFERAWKNFGKDVPVFSIMFGDASEEQLTPLAQLTRGRVFDGRKDLIAAFRTAKGYN